MLIDSMRSLLKVFGRIAFAYGIIIMTSVILTPGIQLIESFIAGLLIGTGASLGWDD
jgi:hypothetical protein